MKITSVTIEVSDRLFAELITHTDDTGPYRDLTDQIEWEDTSGVLSLSHDELLEYTEAWFEGWDTLEEYLKTGDTRDVQYPHNELHTDTIIEEWLRPLLNLYYIAIQKVRTGGDTVG